MASVLAFDLPKKHSRRFFDLNDPILEEGNLEKLIDKSPRLSWEAKKKIKANLIPIKDAPLHPSSGFRILAQWDEGGWGKVYIAWHLGRAPGETDSLVALKINKNIEELSPIILQQFDEREYTIPEVKAKEDFRHKQLKYNVMPIRQEGRDQKGNETTFYSMRFYEEFLHRTLETHPWTDKKSRREESIVVFEDLAKSLEELTEEGIIHGDIKPSNVAIETNGRRRYMLADHGIRTKSEHFEDDPNRTDIGYKYTKAPWLFTEEKVQRRHSDDVWGVASLVYRLFTGKYILQDEIDEVEHNVEQEYMAKAMEIQDARKRELFLHNLKRNAVNKHMEYLSRTRWFSGEYGKLIHEKLKKHWRIIPKFYRNVLEEAFNGHITDGKKLVQKLKRVRTPYDILRKVVDNAKPIGTGIAVTMAVAELFVILSALPDKHYEINITPDNTIEKKLEAEDIIFSPKQQQEIYKKLEIIKANIQACSYNKGGDALQSLVSAYWVACDSEGVSQFESYYFVNQGGMGVPLECSLLEGFMQLISETKGDSMSLNEIILSMRPNMSQANVNVAKRTQLYYSWLLQGQADRKNETESEVMTTIRYTTK